MVGGAGLADQQQPRAGRLDSAPAFSGYGLRPQVRHGRGDQALDVRQPGERRRRRPGGRVAVGEDAGQLKLVAATVLGERGDQRVLPRSGDPHQPQKAINGWATDRAMLSEGCLAQDRPKDRQVVTP